MTMAFIGGPRAGEQQQSYKAVPTQVVPVYAPAGDGTSVCADEQVIVRLGVYRRRPGGPHGEVKWINGRCWVYDWEPEGTPRIAGANPTGAPCKGWAESDLEHLAHG